MPALFDAYIIVDWSAAAKPVTGANSIWIGVCTRRAHAQPDFRSFNPATRLAARAQILGIAQSLIAEGKKLLIGFDFAMGYPSGTAELLGLDCGQSAPWRAMYDFLSDAISETPDNANARFALAAKMNARMTGSAHPFWGVPARQSGETLEPRKGDFSAPDSIAEHRRAEAWIRRAFTAHPKSVWQLLGAGAVGSQSLLGIPTVAFLRDQIADAQIWPFETGLRPLTATALKHTSCVLAEIYPSTVSATPVNSETRDESQVRTLSERFESLDSTGKLADAFGAPDSITGSEIHKITAEEGWILAK